MPEPRRRLSADVRREQILEVASQLFIEQGFENIKMADIAERLQTSRPNIYTYYPSTEAILDTLLERRVAEWLQEIDRRVAEDSLFPPVQLLAALLEHRELLLLLHSGGGPHFQARRQRVLDSLDRQTIDYLPPEISAAHPDLILMQRTLVLSIAHELLLNPDYDREQVGRLMSVMLFSAYESRVPDIAERIRQHHSRA
ncbi:TetR/AcrR family transcriptional regulator [Deinococcus wulumuqiensis]|uniref:TetR family transcriptional regulator n=1 Tax=Deinococcus wulumuqiensis TaxID=980427 RepID=A0AAV4K6J8_9DEIO|nr:TetR/AcrR family transcriptional regulator [Deinococcus wulumuqiensis]QII21511.1 TetR/AcrR family transcriptional regulator [Deinococcus wulumuqiensis R12]GGI90074.1 TetR family transcriptional regulator [Deinococcus wulumuqiensis]GGP30685.1 TetR family transcriptional regulator [Deinococcus wulumuqiensis]